MQTFTAIYKDKIISFTNNATAEEIGKMYFENKADINFQTAEDEYQFITTKNSIEVLINGEKIDKFERKNRFRNFQSNNSYLKIKGISSWKGGTKLIDSQNKTLVTLHNKSALIDKRAYEFKTFAEVDPYQLMLMLALHIEGSKIKTTIAIAASVLLAPIIANFFN